MPREHPWHLWSTVCRRWSPPPPSPSPSPVRARENTAISVTGVGTLDVTTTTRTSTGITAVAPQLVLDTARAGLPAGTVIHVGYARAGVTAS